MAILNFTTKIDSEKTIGEITKCLVKHGATKITTDYNGQIAVAVTFCLMYKDSLIAFSLPANFHGVFRAMKKDRNVPRRLCTEQQAQRVAWRIVKDWTEAQMAIVEAELAEMAEVFLPYAVTKDGSTLFNKIKAGGFSNILQIGEGK